ncbi:MAG: ATP-binding protein [Roseimicrobium sp.]
MDTTESVPCVRCGSAVPGMRMQEVLQIRSLFDRDPLVLCECCERNDVMEKAARKAPPRERALPEWPDEWPRRSIMDLQHFKDRPLRMAGMIGKELEQKQGTFAILGDRGRGKTVMATWLAEQRRLQHLNPGTYVRSHDLFATIRRAWHPQSKEDEWTVLERYRTTPLLVIDEFQERSESDWENRTLVNIVDHRHANMLPTILIANLSAKAFTESVGASLADRISQTGGIVECGWGNLRRG